MDYLPIFVGVTAAAVVIQAGILVALYVAVRKTTSRMETLATEVTAKVMPTVDTAQSMMVEWRPKIDTIASNVSETSTVVRGQVERLDATVTDIVDRTRLQVIRADELLNRTMDRIEENLRRLPPQNIEAEESVIGGVMLDNTAFSSTSMPALWAACLKTVCTFCVSEFTAPWNSSFRRLPSFSRTPPRPVFQPASSSNATAFARLNSADVCVLR